MLDADEVRLNLWLRGLGSIGGRRWFQAIFMIVSDTPPGLTAWHMSFARTVCEDCWISYGFIGDCIDARDAHAR